MPKKPKIPVLSEQEPLRASPWDALKLPDFAEPKPSAGPNSPADAQSQSEQPEPPSPVLSAKAKPLRVVVRRETSGRAGKPVLVLFNWQPALSPAELSGLLSDIKKALGCGGSLRQDELELQIREPARLLTFLEKRGIQARGDI